jgi:SAM-dependent methyltransferase
LLDNVLEHIQNPENLLKEIYRVLRSGGKLLVGVPGIKGQHSDPDHKIFYDESALRLLAQRHQFWVTEQFHMPLFKSSWLSKSLSQYCVYSVWKKDKTAVCYLQKKLFSFLLKEDGKLLQV